MVSLSTGCWVSTVVRTIAFLYSYSPANVGDLAVSPRLCQHAQIVDHLSKYGGYEQYSDCRILIFTFHNKEVE